MIKEYNDSTWQGKAYSKIVDTTQQVTSFPVVVRPMENIIPNWTIIGNMSQTGTPTPQNPIQPSECGDLETEGAKAGQYKIPISSASTTTPVYLGEVQSTRKIKKLVLTGNENWDGRTGEPSNVFFCSKSHLGITSIEGYGICSHYRYTTGGSFSNLSDGEFIISATNLGFRNTAIQDLNVAAWIQYLRQQYANGTPVTVWYVLATETTTTLNEPLRKIGDYADTVSGTNLSVTAQSPTTIDVDTTLKPSEMDLIYTGLKMCGRKKYVGGGS